jgi:hypothetical protein
MAKSTKIRNGKRAGRPKSTGAGKATMVRLHEPHLKALDRWIGDSGISRPEAIRQLVDWGLRRSQVL